jgi:anti-sigma factor RsiW
MIKKDSDVKIFNGIKERDIHAYIDGHLDPARARLVEAYLERHPEIATEVRDYVESNQLLKQAYTPTEEEEVPARLVSALNRPVSRPGS